MLVFCINNYKQSRTSPRGGPGSWNLMAGDKQQSDTSRARQKGKKKGCPQEGKGHPNKRVSMVFLYITKPVMIVNKKVQIGFSAKKEL